MLILSQLIEGFVSIDSSPITDILAIEGINIIKNNKGETCTPLVQQQGPGTHQD